MLKFRFSSSVTPKDGHTSMVIAKIDDEFPCLEYHNTLDDRLTAVQHVETILHSLTIMVSASILIIHLLFKTLRTSLICLESYSFFTILARYLQVVVLLLFK